MRPPPATHPRPTHDPRATHPEGLSRRSSRRGLLQRIRLAFANGLSRTGSSGQALADAPSRLTSNSTCCCCSRSPVTHPRPTTDPPRGALAEALSQRSSYGELSQMGLSRTGSRERAPKNGHRSSHASPFPPPHSYQQMPGYLYI